MMDRLFFNIALLCCIAAFFVLLKRQFHMLQLNSYRNDRYKKWAAENFNKEINIWYIFSVLVSCAIMKTNVPVWLFAAVFALTLLLALCFTPRRKEKKKFVITARVKRLYITAALLSLILIAVLNVAIGKDVYIFGRGFSDRFIIFIVFWVVLWAICFRPAAVRLINNINKPFEKMCANYYVRDAKKKLCAMNDLTVIGITGSYGKTGTKYILERFLSESFNTLMTPESYNTPMGVVRTIREKLSPSHKYFICEMGAKQKGDIKEICDIVHPTHGIVTSVGPCHLESFGSIDNIAATKLELYEACDGINIIGADSEALSGRSYEKPVIMCGVSDTADYRATDIKYGPDGMTFTLDAKGRKIEIRTPLLGQSGAKNITAAAAMALELGVPADSIQYAASRLKAVEHRLDINRKSPDYIVIDDAFNSNPAGAKEALSVLKSFENHTRILITPGMVELGEKEQELNKEMGAFAAAAADYIIAVGKNADAIRDGALSAEYDESRLFCVKNLNEALAKLAELKGEKTVVLFENDLPDNYEQ